MSTRFERFESSAITTQVACFRLVILLRRRSSQVERVVGHDEDASSKEAPDVANSEHEFCDTARSVTTLLSPLPPLEPFYDSFGIGILVYYMYAHPVFISLSICLDITCRDSRPPLQPRSS
jgi:hypothetical protein